MGLIDLFSRRVGRAALLASAAALIATQAVAQSTDFSRREGDVYGRSEAEMRWQSAEDEFWRLCDLTDDIDLPGLREQFSNLEKRAEQIRKDAYAEGTSSVGTREISGKIQKRLGFMRARLDNCVERLQFWIDSAEFDRKLAEAARTPSAPEPEPPQGLSVADWFALLEAETRNEVDIVDEELDELKQLYVQGDCEALKKEIARLKALSLNVDQRYRLNAISALPCPPESWASPTTSAPPAQPSTPSFVQALAPLKTGLAAAIADCDRAAFKAAKNLLLEAIGQMISRSPNDPALLAERRRIEETQMPEPCPPDSRTSLAPLKLDAASATFLALHNQARAEVGAPPLQWDPALAASAKAYAIKLTSAGQLVHSSREGRKTVRENLLQNLPGGRTPTQMIGVWTDEKRHFTPGVFPDVSSTGNWYDIGHYTQMIWETTTRVGCATNGDARFEWLVCHYSPPGNKDGKPVGRTSMPQPRHVVASNPPMPQLRGVAGQDGIAPETSTTTGPPPPPPPPTARDDAPDGNEARHPLNGYFNVAYIRHAVAVDCGDRATAEAEMAKMRYALDELKKRLKAARKAGPYSAVKPADVQRQIDDMEQQLRSAELRPGPGACPPMPQPRGVVAQ